VALENLKTYVPLTPEQIDKYWPIVQKVTDRYLKKATLPPFIDRDDINQELYIALLEALNTFDNRAVGPSGRHMKLHTWIKKICLYRIIDFIRRSSWIPRTAYSKIKAVPDKNVPTQYSSGDMSEANLSLNDGTSSYKSYEIDDTSHNLERDNLANILFKNLHTGNSHRTRCMLHDYFIFNHSMKHIANAYKITESRVCQIIARVLPEVIRRATRYRESIL